MTAEEILKQYKKHSDTEYWEYDTIEAMKEYAKLKCQELLLIVAKKARIDFRNNKANDFGIDVDSIINAVDLDSFIK